MMIEWLKASQLNYLIAATKSDKLKRNQLKPRLQEIAEELKVSPENVLFTSAKDRTGRKPLLTFIKEAIARNQ